MAKSPAILMTLRAQPARADRTDPTASSFEWLPHMFGRVVAVAGGTPLCISNECPPEAVEGAVRRCDGLFLTGGEDIAPEYWGETDTVGNLELHPERDAVEFAAITVADTLGMPILGVCRGAQVLNVARGGSLFQDLPQQYPGTLRDHSRGGTGPLVQSHDLEVTEGSRLHALLQLRSFRGATSHHQAIREPGGGLVVVARSPEDGVIEAVEEPGDRFVIGVQWHPEVHPEDQATRRLFAAFVAACRRFAGNRG